MPQFKITSAGLSAVSQATPVGPFVNIVAFKIGSDFSTDPTSFDTGMAGTVLYSGVPTSYSRLDADTVGVRCEIPGNVGPFKYGEIGLFLPGDILFARCSFGAPIDKFSGTLNGIVNTARFIGLLKFSQAPALLNVTTNTTAVVEVSHFGLLSPPGAMPGSPNMVLVHEPNAEGQDILVWKTNSVRWTIAKYNQFLSSTITAGTTTSITSPSLLTVAGATPGQYLVEFPNGDIRRVVSINLGVAALSQSTTAYPVGTPFILHKANEVALGKSLAAASNLDYNSLANEFNLTWTGPTGTTETDARGWGQTPVPTTTTGSSTSDWASLGAAVTKAYSLAGKINPFEVLSITPDFSADFILRLRQYNQLTEMIRFLSERGLGGTVFAKTDKSTALVRTRSATYQQIHHDVTATFTSNSTMKTFFNSGGWLGFKVDITSDNMVESIQRLALAQLGFIRLGASFSESTGSLRIRVDSGDGVIGDIGNCGFYGLSSTRKKVWTYMIPVTTPPFTSASSGYILFEMYATLSTNNTVKIEFWITDNTGAVYSNAANLPPMLVSSSMYSGRPDFSVLNSPVIDHPTLVTATSTSW